MNATTIDPPTAEQRTDRASRLLGLGNLVRKDVADWLHSRRPWVVLVVTTSVFALAAANARITEWAIRSLPADPGTGRPRSCRCCRSTTSCSRSARNSSCSRSIFATMSLLVAERDSGTLAWTISKPVSRTSVLVSKWLTVDLRPLGDRRGRHPAGGDDCARDRALRPPRSRRRRRPRRHPCHSARVLRRRRIGRRARSCRARRPSARSAWPSSSRRRSSVASSRLSRLSSLARSSTRPLPSRPAARRPL